MLKILMLLLFKKVIIKKIIKVNKILSLKWQKYNKKNSSIKWLVPQ